MMVGEIPLPQIDGGRSTSKRERLFAPIRGLCGLVRDESGHSVHGEHWVTRRAFLKTHSDKSGRLPAHAHLLSWMFHPPNGNK